MSNISWNSFGNNNSDTNNRNENLAQYSSNNNFFQKHNLGTMFNFTNNNRNKRSFDQQNTSFMNCDDMTGNTTRLHENQMDQYANDADISMKPTKIKRRRMKVISSPHHEKTAAILIQGQREYFQRCSGEINDLLYEEDYDDDESDFDSEQEAEIRKMNSNYKQKPFWPISSPRKRSSSVPLYVSADTKVNENIYESRNFSGTKNDLMSSDNSDNISKVASHSDNLIRKQMIEELRCQVCNEVISHSLRQSLKNFNGNFDINEHSCSRCKKILCGLCCFNGDYGPVSCFNCRYE